MAASLIPCFSNLSVAACSSTSCALQKGHQSAERKNSRMVPFVPFNVCRSTVLGPSDRGARMRESCFGLRVQWMTPGWPRRGTPAVAHLQTLLFREKKLSHLRISFRDHLSNRLAVNL